MNGSDREVIFRQDHPPRRMGLSDFAEVGDLGGAIAGQRFEGPLYHLRLPFSGFEHPHATLGGESSTTLAEGSPNTPWAKARHL